MSDLQWPLLTEGLLEAIWVVDPSTHRILSANRAATQLQQLDDGALTGVSVEDMVASPEDLLFWECLDPSIEDSLHSETQLRRADGSTVWVERRISLVRTGDGQARYLVAMQDKTSQRETEHQLEERVAELRATLESTGDGILVTDLDGGIRAFNHRFTQLWDLPSELLVRKDDPAIHAHLVRGVPDAAHYQARIAQIQRAPLQESCDVLVLRNGRVLERISRPQLARGSPIGRVYLFRDITERSAHERQLKLAAKVFESSREAIFVTDPEQRIVTCNPVAERLTGRALNALQGLAARSLFTVPPQSSWQAELDCALEQQGYWEGETWLRQADGTTTTLLVSWVVLREAQGAMLNHVLFVRDLSEKLAAQQRIEQLAYTDALTGLPNRLLLTDRVHHAIRLSERSHAPFAILFLDLDRFKSINDSLGHLFGDRVLVEIASRLQHCLRQTDTLCRLGGDEFVIHLHEADALGAEHTAQRIIDTVTHPITLQDMSFNLSCSVGISMYPQDGKTLDELVQHADTAMYQVKERGKGHYRFYRPQMNADLLARIQLDHAMREGLRRQEFVLHYQPRIRLAAGRVDACEALVRWQRPESGLVSPGIFIPLAEETGFIVALGQWVLQEAVRQAAEWHRAGLDCQVAVNVSALQFQQTHFVEEVSRLLVEHGLPPYLLELELTESILIRDAEEALERLQALADLGVQLALDDFGTGYSSMAYLKRFPLHKLKIDRSFIASLHEGDADADVAIVSAIIQMGHALKMEVVAEGVELQAQQQVLHTMGCDHFQGFLFSPAVPPEAFLAQWARGATDCSAP